MRKSHLSGMTSQTGACAWQSISCTKSSDQSVSIGRRRKRVDVGGRVSGGERVMSIVRGGRKTGGAWGLMLLILVWKMRLLNV